mmetsp:Transcript_23617/g.46221  ORF Transcript_23617/g.46221 Transcript_23617/m.46221 type:complete len:316 (+) Transcript_23617:693-1640(+)
MGRLRSHCGHYEDQALQGGQGPCQAPPHQPPARLVGQDRAGIHQGLQGGEEDAQAGIHGARGARAADGGPPEALAAIQHRADEQAVRAVEGLARDHSLLPHGLRLREVHAPPAGQAQRLRPGAGRQDALPAPNRVLGDAVRPHAGGAGVVRLRDRGRRADVLHPDLHGDLLPPAHRRELERDVAAGHHREGQLERPHRRRRARDRDEQLRRRQVPPRPRPAVVPGSGVPRRNGPQNDPREGHGPRAEALAVRHSQGEALCLLRPGAHDRNGHQAQARCGCRAHHRKRHDVEGLRPGRLPHAWHRQGPGHPPVHHP